jgi:hypothetical protein
MCQSRCAVCGERVKVSNNRVWLFESLLHTVCMKQILSGLAEEVLDSGIIFVADWNHITITEPDGTQWG